MSKNKLFLIATYIGALAFLGACSSETSFDEGSSGLPTVAAQSPQFTTEFYQAGTLVYSDSPAIGRAQMISGNNYSLSVKPLNSVAATYSVRMVNRDTGATLLSQSVVANQSVALTFPVADDYQLITVAIPTSGAAVSKTVNIAVACSASSFSVNSAGISVASSGSNMFTYTATGVSPGGTDYECAWDFNGDGLLDRDYASCGTSVQAISNQVGSRRISVSVRRISCNTQVTASRTLTVQEPIAGAGINFIRGDVAQPGDATNPRTNQTHASTNNDGLELALCNYDDSAGVWSITGANNYYSTGQALSLPTSKNHGLALSIAGAPRGGVTSGAISTANARISNSRFVTDAQSDGLPQFTFRTSTCTLSNFQLTATPVAGTPCAGGGSLVEPGATVIAEGQFNCGGMLANENALLPPVGVSNGRFFCIFHIGDSCIGGGGGGGGGIPPIKF